MSQLLIGKKCIHVCAHPISHNEEGWKYHEERRVVVLLAISGIYAMVKRPKCAPYVCTVKELVAE